MHLMMYLGKDLIEAVPLDREQVPVPGYLGSVKRHLKEKYKTLIQEAAQPLEFLVVPENSRGLQPPRAGNGEWSVVNGSLAVPCFPGDIAD